VQGCCRERVGIVVEPTHHSHMSLTMLNRQGGRGLAMQQRRRRMQAKNVAPCCIAAPPPPPSQVQPSKPAYPYGVQTLLRNMGLTFEKIPRTLWLRKQRESVHREQRVRVRWGATRAKAPRRCGSSGL
jgi:hypothetical protein